MDRMIVTNYFLRRSIRRLSKESALRSHCYRSLNEVKSVLVLCEAGDWDAVKPCIKKLKAMRKTVHLCIYLSRKDATPIWDDVFLLIEEKKDVNLWGFPSKPIRKQLQELATDLLLDLTGGNRPVMRYLMLQQPCAFKVGAKYAPNDAVYDFSIIMKHGVPDIPFLFGQIMNYLQTIRSR